jgi:hypothetical protein
MNLVLIMLEVYLDVGGRIILKVQLREVGLGVMNRIHPPQDTN